MRISGRWPRRRSRPGAALRLEQGIQDVDFLLADDFVGRGVGLVAGHAFEIEDMAGGDGVEDETLAQVVGMVEPAILDAGAGLQRLEEELDGPSQHIPADGGLRGLHKIANPGGLRFGAAFGAGSCRGLRW